NPDFVVVTGGSAGGSLAALVALTANDPEYQPGFEHADTSVAGCVAFYGVYDFTNRSGYWLHKGLARLLERRVMKVPLASAPAAYEKASPIARITAAAPPFFVVHGSHDTMVPVAEARAFAHGLRAATGGPVVYAEIPGAVEEAVADPSVRVLVLRGHGEEAFTAGADISEFTTRRGDAAGAAAYEAATVHAFDALMAVAQPVVAMIHGACVGAGLALAACADLRVAADDVRLQLPAARLGLGYHFSGVERLVRLVGPSATAEIFFTPRPYTAV